MATKKKISGSATEKNGKGKGKGKGEGKGDLLVEDPPVVVGGGNSVDIIFKNSATNPSNPPGRRKFRLTNTITSVIVYDGINPGTQTIPVSGTFWVEFSDLP